MKKLFPLFITSLALVFAACEKEDINPTPKRWDPGAMVLLKPAEGVQLKSSTGGLTSLQIVEQTEAIRWTSQWSYVNDDMDIQRHFYYETPRAMGRIFAEGQRDYDIPALKMWGTDIIGQVGGLAKDFIYSWDVYLTTSAGDTIGYVANEVIEAARIQIEEAYWEEDYETVYRLFDEAFTFLPMPE